MPDYVVIHKGAGIPPQVVTLSGSSTDVMKGDGTFGASSGSEAFPVGSVFIAVVSTNPGTLLGYGTWSAFGAGRVLIGRDSGDTDFDTAEETGGAKTSSALIAHTHGVTDPGHNHTQNSHNHTQDSHSHMQSSTATATGGGTNRVGASDTSSTAENTGGTVATNQAATATNNSATTGVTVNSAGSGSSFSLMNPFIVCYFWKRTA